LQCGACDTNRLIALRSNQFTALFTVKNGYL